MCETLGVEQFDNGRDRSNRHHDQMGQTIPVNANEKLAEKRRINEKGKKKTGYWCAHRRPCSNCQLFFLRNSLHGHDVKLPAAPLTQFGKGILQAFMVFSDQMPFNGLARDVRNNDFLDTASSWGPV